MLGKIAKLFKKEAPAVVLKTEDIAYAENALLTSFDYVDYNPDDLIGRKGYKVYQTMMTDEQVKAVVRFRRDSITGRTWGFEDNSSLSDAENAKRKEVLTAILKKVDGSFKTKLDAMMSSLTCGFSMVEKSFDLMDIGGKQWYGIKSLTKKPFDSFYFKLDNFGQLVGVEQRLGAYSADLKLKDFVHHVHNADVHPYYGQSELREAYRAYWSKDITHHLQNVWLERAAAGFTIAKPLKGKTLTLKSPEYTAIKSVLSNLRSNASVLFPADMDITIIHPSDTQAFDRAITGHDKAIAKALLMPNLLGLSEQGPGGSRALGDTQLEAFLWILDSESMGLVETVNEQLIADLARLNFPDGLFPRWILMDLSEKKSMEQLDKFIALVNGNAITPLESDEVHARQLLKFPEKSKGEEESDNIDPATALSGTQVAAMLTVLDKVAAGSLPRKTGIQVLINSFPINSEQAEAIMGEVGNGFEPKTETPVPEDEPELDDEGDPIPREPQPPPNTDEQVNPILQDPDDETIRPKKRVVITTGRMKAVIDRVEFAVIASKSESIETAFIIDLSARNLDLLTPVTNDLVLLDTMSADKVQDVKFSSRQISKLQASTKRMLTSSWALGIKHAKSEINRASGKTFTVDFARLDNEAADFFNSKSFTMTGKLTADMLAIIQNELSQAIKSSASGRNTVDAIYRAMAAKGFLTLDDAQSQMQDILDSKESATARLATVVRTNSFEAINEARYSYFTDSTLDEFVQALEYSSILDSRTTQICNHLDGHTHAAEGDIWGKIYRPPNHFNCRSLLIPVTTFDTWEEDEPPELLPQEGFR